jgi:V8-like Glu-specific endopeptidase
MRSKLAILVPPIALLVAGTAPDSLSAQASGAPDASQRVAEAGQQPAPPDPFATRARDSRSGGIYLQLPEELRGLQPIMPRAPKEGPASPDALDTVVHELAGATYTLPAPPPTAGQEAALRKVDGSSGDLPTNEVNAETIIGPDGRSRVFVTTDYPFRTVVFLAIGFPGGGSGAEGWCTGEIIDGFHVMTAGHCVHEGGGGNWADYFQVIPARDENYMPYSYAWWTVMRSYTGWTVSGDWNHDWAVVTLDRNVGNFTGWMGRFTAGPSHSWYFGTLNNAGYGSHRPNGVFNDPPQMFFDSDTGSYTTDTKHWYWMDTLGGNSGGPVWVFDGTSRYIGTVHAYGESPGFGNSGTRLNQDKYDRIFTWLAADSPPTDYPDYVDDGFFYHPTSVIRGHTNMFVGSDVRNIGTANPGSFWVDYFLSTDSNITTSDYFVCFATVAGVSPFNWANSDCNGTAPSNIPPGTYYFGAVLDTFNQRTEFNEGNNQALSPFLVTVSLPTVSVVASDAVATEAGSNPGTFTFTRNAVGPSALAVTYSISGSATNGSDYSTLSGSVTIPANATQASVDVNPILDTLVEVETVTLTILSTASYNAGSPSSATVTIYDGPNLIVKTVSAPASSGSGQTITIGATTNNIGNGPAGASTTRLYWSTNAALDANDAVIGDLAVPALGAGGTSTSSLSYAIPGATAIGTYYIIVRADAFGAVDETKEADNNKAKKILIAPDLRVTAVNAPASAPQGSVIDVTEFTRNELGSSPAPASTTSIYLSVDNKWDAGDTLLSSRGVPGLADGASDSFTHSVTLPTGSTGTRYLIGRADSPRAILERNETNNNKPKVINITP